MPTTLDQLAKLAAGAANALPAARGGDWSGAGAAFARGLVGRVEIRSQVAPPIVLDPFAEGDPNAQSNPFLPFIRPQLIVYDPQGQVTMTASPYGEPTANYFPWLVGGAIIFAVGAVTVIGAIGAAISRRRARR